MSEPTSLADAVEQLDIPVVDEPAPEPKSAPKESESDEPKGLADFAGDLVDQELAKGNDLFKGDPDKEDEPENEETEEQETEEPEGDETEKDEEKDDDTKDMTPSAGARFKELKGNLKAAKAEIEALKIKAESALTEDDAKAQADQLDALQKEVDQYRQERSAYMLDKTPEFQEKITKPLADLGSSIKSLAERNGLDEQELFEAYETADPKSQTEKLNDIADALNPRDSKKLYDIADELDLVFKLRDDLRENATQAMAEIEAKRAEAREEERKIRTDAYKKAASATWDKLAERLGLDDSSNKVRDNGLAFDFMEASADDQAYGVYAGMLLPQVVAEKKSLAKRVAELENSVKRATGSIPGAGSGSGAAAPELPAEDEDMATFADRAFRSAGFKR